VRSGLVELVAATTPSGSRLVYARAFMGVLRTEPSREWARAAKYS
jgi:hypothetical protein